MAIKVSMVDLARVLKDGPLAMNVLCERLGHPSVLVYDFADEMERFATVLDGMKEMGLEGQTLTIFPARSRERYGFENLVPVVKVAKPTTRKPRATPAKPKPVRKDGTQAVTYWPFVALGTIVPTEAGEAVKYDGRWDAEERNLNEIFAEDFKDEGSLWYGWSVRATNGSVKLIPPGE